MLNSAELPVDELISLSEPYPNPAYESSLIDYDISSLASEVDLVIFDISGLIKLRLKLQPPAGSLQLHKSLLGSGMYFLRIEYDSGASEIQKLIFE